MPIEFEKQYDQERCLFEVVGPRFQRQRWLSAYDLFSIARWKANRAISKVASSLVHISGSGLEQTSRELTQDIFKACDDHERFLVASGKWKLRLPMASAILTVLFPDAFTVYDVRACEFLGDFSNLADKANLVSRWQRYVAFVDAVKRSTPANLSLRDKDRYLWARSRHDALKHFVKRDFSVRAHRTTTSK
jgi:hypothetical protein